MVWPRNRPKIMFMTNLHRRAVIAGLATIGFAASTRAQTPALSAADRADVARIEAYFNGIRTLRARFRQMTQANNRPADGTFYLSRPGRLRLEYDPPVPTLLIAVSGQLLHYDSALGQSSYVPVNSTPAGLLIRETVTLSGDVTVTRVERPQGQLRVTMVRTREPEGSVAFTFRAEPLELIDWIVTDGSGRITRVQLTEMQVGIPLDGALFRPPTAPNVNAR